MTRAFPCWTRYDAERGEHRLVLCDGEEVWTGSGRMKESRWAGGRKEEGGVGCWSGAGSWAVEGTARLGLGWGSRAW